MRRFAFRWFGLGRLRRRFGGLGDTVPIITDSDVPDGVENVAYEYTINVSGGNPPLSWTVIAGSLPTGLTLGPSTGTLSGTPTTPGTYNYTVQVEDDDLDTDTLVISQEIAIQYLRKMSPLGMAIRRRAA